MVPARFSTVVVDTSVLINFLHLDRLDLLGLLPDLIRSGLLTVIEADLMKKRLEAHRFRLPFASFADFV